MRLEEGDAAEHLLTERSVRLHQASLLRGQRAGFLEDLVGDSDLADVVEEEAVRRALVGCNEPDPRRRRDGITLDSLRVRPRPRVLRLERARERRDGFLVGLLEEVSLSPLDLEQMSEVARVEQQLLTRVRASRRSVRHAVEPARQPLDDGEQLERAERLQEECVGAGAPFLRGARPSRSGSGR